MFQIFKVRKSPSQLLPQPVASDQGSLYSLVYEPWHLTTY